MSAKLRYIWWTILLVALAFFSFLMIRLSLPYTALRSDIDFLKSKQGVYYIPYWRVSFFTHVFTSCLVLLAGFTQFNGWILRRYPRVHRVMGYVYVLTVVFVTGPAALVMGFYANGGLPARTSFVLLASLWITFTTLAWWFAVRKRFLLHGAFLYRSYALTLSALTLRSYTFLLQWFQAPVHPRDIYIVTAWLSWVPNLLVAEWLIQYRGVGKMLRAGRRRPSQTSPKR
ncbi:DUF2306 domain-containing protein [Dinghuibacter silviterrae]|uniref:Putative membrane protein DUF2306 n=1 Tax=Dinghuibacter silviterrae TaxID=1539049 RepID=A0A4R8DHK6_9BACT|nr:DUF2306 domain-containing protein [Dinghuibacter silviterrae]TDW97015.1 putative membrane protein DUF2306 [Dinghuibacter silviterrae]